MNTPPKNMTAEEQDLFKELKQMIKDYGQEYIKKKPCPTTSKMPFILVQSYDGPAGKQSKCKKYKPKIQPKKQIPKEKPCDPRPLAGNFYNNYNYDYHTKSSGIKQSSTRIDLTNRKDIEHGQTITGDDPIDSKFCRTWRRMQKQKDEECDIIDDYDQECVKMEMDILPVCDNNSIWHSVVRVPTTNQPKNCSQGYD